jgi:putative Holliday junction resolvase
MYNADEMRISQNIGRVLAIDWGEKRIGIAISDEMGMFARPFTIIKAGSYLENAKQIVEIADTQQVMLIVIGVTYYGSGELSPSGRRADRLGEAIKRFSEIPVIHFNESRSTQEAKDIQITIGSARKDRKGHLDSQAAAIFLQKYLDEECHHE